MPQSDSSNSCKWVCTQAVSIADRSWAPSSPKFEWETLRFLIWELPCSNLAAPAPSCIQRALMSLNKQIIDLTAFTKGAPWESHHAPALSSRGVNPRLWMSEITGWHAHVPPPANPCSYSPPWTLVYYLGRHSSLLQVLLAMSVAFLRLFGIILLKMIWQIGQVIAAQSTARSWSHLQESELGDKLCQQQPREQSVLIAGVSALTQILPGCYRDPGPAMLILHAMLCPDSQLPHRICYCRAVWGRWGKILSWEILPGILRLQQWCHNCRLPVLSTWIWCWPLRLLLYLSNIQKVTILFICWIRWNCLLPMWQTYTGMTDALQGSSPSQSQGKHKGHVFNIFSMSTPGKLPKQESRCLLIQWDAICIAHPCLLCWCWTIVAPPEMHFYRWQQQAQQLLLFLMGFRLASTPSSFYYSALLLQESGS